MVTTTTSSYRQWQHNRTWR